MSNTIVKDKTNVSYKGIVIVGVGNRLMGDDGVGLHIIDNLSRIPIPSHVKIIDCGCDLFRLVAHIGNPHKLIIIDTIRAGGKPGQIYRFNWDELCTAHRTPDGARPTAETARLSCGTGFQAVKSRPRWPCHRLPPAEMQSAHQIGARDALNLMRQIYPAVSNCEIVVIGIEPKTIGLSTELSKEAAESIADATRLVLKEISAREG